ncbi:extracellular solute-binding protein [Subtercola endophyticus]|uniref:extracellular solute-binding protein n=1 Tax=Subtercola endophyticus TaxID=2895559 RepID=UPI001E342CF2|nr:extracellular solute-binding protein [Subtercola endophyticus]UFS60645.1 extracellular solute-binding protein [Subtercola endophyticus]
MPISTRLAAVAVTAVAALALTGCVGGASATTSTGAAGSVATIPTLGPDQKVSITFESYNLAQAGAWTDTIQGLISTFESQHPNITVTGQAPATAAGANTSYISSVQTEMLAGNAPDVAQLTFDGLDYIANDMGAQPISQLVGEQAVQDAFGGQYPMNPKATKLGDWNGVTYGIPYVFSTPVLWYNATALADAGITNPDFSTWDGLEKVAEELKAKTGTAPLTISCTVTGGDWCMQGIIKSNGGSIVSADHSTIEFGDDGSIGAVEEMRKLNDEGLLQNLDSTSMYNAFAAGKSLIQVQTSALQSAFMAGAKAGGWELKNTTLPAFGSTPVAPTNSGSALFIMSKDPAKQAAAWEFIKFMTSPTAYEQISTKIGYLPLRDTMTEGDGPLAAWAKSNPLVAPNIAQLQKLQPWESYPGSNYSQISTIFSKAVEDSIYYGKDPKATMQAAQQQAQALVK